MNILFVCTGNTCRSPMAETLLRDKYPSVQVKSAGVFATDGGAISGNAQKVLEEKDISVSHRSQSVTDELLQWADLVLTMTMQHKHLLIMEQPDYQEKYYTLKEYVSLDQEIAEDQAYDISDPFGGGVDVYRATRTELERAIAQLTEKLKRQQGEA